MIDLNANRQMIIDVATNLFEKFVNMPQSERSDDKERTGIQVFVWEADTRNLVMASIKEPSDAAKFFAIEKAVRSHVLGDMSSANSADPSKLKYAGSVSITYSSVDEDSVQKSILRASVSGLKAEEDVAISVAILATLIGASFEETCRYVIEEHGELPDWYEKDRSYFQFLFE